MEETKKTAVNGQVSGEDAEQVLSDYNNELRDVYRQIDRSSSLLWSHDNGLHRPRRRNTKKEIETNDDYKWRNESKAQFGYGEITKGALQEFLSILQNVDKLFRLEDEEYMTGSKQSYNLTSSSTFIDIGSGFGKPVFHAAMQVGWASRGIEIVPARVEFWVDFTFDYQDKNKTRIETYEKYAQSQQAKLSKGTLTPSKAKRRPKPVEGFVYHNGLDTDEYDGLYAEINKTKEDKGRLWWCLKGF